MTRCATPVSASPAVMIQASLAVVAASALMVWVVGSNDG